MSNQFTLAREQGLEPGDEGYPEGTNQFIKGTRVDTPEDVRRRISVSKIVAKLESIIDEEGADKQHVLAASKILLDKSLSSLSSVEQTISDGSQESTEQTEAKLRMLINKAEPALLSRLLGERARALTGNTPSDHDQDSTIPAQSIAK